MTISKDLFLSILSLDSYNHGYDANISGLGEAGTKIGGATIKNVSLPEGSQAASFYAVAYDVSGAGIEGWGGETTVISYRGTNDILGLNDAARLGGDLWNGWTLGAGWDVGSQGGLAIEFFER